MTECIHTAGNELFIVCMYYNTMHAFAKLGKVVCLLWYPSLCLSKKLITVSDNTRRTVLGWKFEHYDRNGDGGLSSGEQWLIEREIDQFVHCSSFFDHVAGLMNGNNDGVIVIREWESFFGGKWMTFIIPS